MSLITTIVQVVASFFGTLGFGFLFNIRGKKLVFAALGGMVAWLLFSILRLAVENEVLRYFVVSLCSTIYAEILARIFKTPATTFSIITLIPLVPGGALYRTATLFMNGDVTLFVTNFIYTMELSIALSLGIVIITSVFKFSRIFIHEKEKP